jgi:hypothetical protein
MMGCAAHEDSEDVDTDEAHLLEAPQGVSYNAGEIALFVGNFGAPTMGLSVLRARFSAAATSQYKTNYRVVPGGLCQRSWLTAPYDAAKDGTAANVGAISATAASESLVAQPLPGNVYAPKIVSPSELRYGDSVTLASAGSDQFAATTKTLTVPFPAVQDAPAADAAVPFGALNVEWSGPAKDHQEIVSFRIEQLPGDAVQPPNGASAPPERKLECLFDSRSGHATIPAALLEPMKGHGVNTFFDTKSLSVSVRFRNRHYERVIVSVGNNTTVRRLNIGD